jgi:hypothetical protein
MNKEFLHMQKLAGLITENEYKSKLLKEEITSQDLNQYKSAMFDQLKFERDERPQELVDDGEFDTIEDAQSVLSGKTDNDLRKIVDITCNNPEFLKAVNREVQKGTDVESAIDIFNWEFASNPLPNLQNTNESSKNEPIGYDGWKDAIYDFIYDNLSSDEDELPDIIRTLEELIMDYKKEIEK